MRLFVLPDGRYDHAEASALVTPPFDLDVRPTAAEDGVPHRVAAVNGYRRGEVTGRREGSITGYRRGEVTLVAQG